MWRFNPINFIYFAVTEVVPICAAGLIGYVLGSGGVL